MVPRRCGSMSKESGTYSPSLGLKWEATCDAHSKYKYLQFGNIAKRIADTSMRCDVAASQTSRSTDRITDNQPSIATALMAIFTA